MGLFSTGKQVLVSSVVYNLAGPPEQRPEYLKSALLSGVFNPADPDLGETITKSLLRGPGMNLRAFGRWARNHGYTSLVGQAAGTLNLPDTIDQVALTAQLPRDPGESVTLQTSSIGVADFTYWAHQYMLQNYPELIETAFTATFNKEDVEITIFFEGGGSETFTPSGYDIGGRYLYATYNRYVEAAEGSVIPGSDTGVADPSEFPSTSGWTLIDTLYDSGAGWTSEEEIWQRDTSAGWVGSYESILITREIMHLLVVTDTGTLEETCTYRVDTQEISHAYWQPLQVLIYQEGTGNTDLDALFSASASVGDFLPYIPIRLDNRFISDTFYADILPEAKKALKKASGADYTKVMAKVAENPSLADIDYAYVVFGASLNAQDIASKRYLYAFFQEVMLGQDLSGDPYRDWELAYAAAVAGNATWKTWADAQSDPGDILYGTLWPEKPAYPPLPYYEIRIRSSGRPTINYDMAIGWNSIEETVGSGILDGAHPVGDIWWESLPRDDVLSTVSSIDLDGLPITYTNDNELCHVKLHWQVSATVWRTLEFRGLHHRNHIYQGNYEITQADDAIVDTEESGFIIPIHEGVLGAMPLTHATQLSVSCTYLLFNCYRVVKEKWYESSWFKVVILVVVIAIAAVTGYVDPNAVGLLGANTAVGVALGATGAVAAIIGSIANAIAATIVAQILGVLTTTVGGPQYGAIVSLAIMAIAGSIQIGGGVESLGDFVQTAFNKLMEAPNLLKLTTSTGEILSGFIKADTQDILRETQETLRDYNETSKEIASLTAALVGGANVMNPLMLTNTSLPTTTGVAEMPETFLARTLLTGSDVAELSTAFISGFTDFTLRTDLLS